MKSYVLQYNKRCILLIQFYLILENKNPLIRKTLITFEKKLIVTWL